MDLPTFRAVDKSISHPRDQWPHAIERLESDGKVEEVIYIKRGEDTLVEVVVNLLNMVCNKK